MPRTYAQLVKAAAAKTWAFPRADVVRVVDGDTVDMNVTYIADLGFDDTISVVRFRSFRLFGCNANETHDPGGPEARDNLGVMLPTGTQLRLSSVKDDKYGGRFLAILWATDAGGEYNVTQRLIDTHWAVTWNGNGVKPKPPWPRPEDVK